MTTALRKNGKKRGHEHIDKHRKHSGGRENAGGMHHHRILFNKYHPSYLGKVDMRYFHRFRNQFHCPIVKIWSLIPQDVRDMASKENVPMVDVTQFCYFKVLWKRILPEGKPVQARVEDD